MSLHDSDGLYVLMKIVSVKITVHKGKSIINPYCALKKEKKREQGHKVLLSKRIFKVRHMLKCLSLPEL